MTDQQHSITPPFELINQWYKKACKDPYEGSKFIMAPVLKEFATAAARWGADQELEACVEWLDDYSCLNVNTQLRAAHRPKPPSLKEQALAQLQQIEANIPQSLNDFESSCEIIRQALEQLND